MLSSAAGSILPAFSFDPLTYTLESKNAEVSQLQLSVDHALPGRSGVALSKKSRTRGIILIYAYVLPNRLAPALKEVRTTMPPCPHLQPL